VNFVRVLKGLLGFAGKQAYLEPISNGMQKPKRGLSTEPFFGLYVVPLYKGGIEKNHTTEQIRAFNKSY